MYLFVESVGEVEATIDLDDQRSIDLPCIAEERDGGARLAMLTPGTVLSPRSLAQVAEAGVAYFVRPSGSAWEAASDIEGPWIEFPDLPTFVDLFEAQQEREDVDTEVTGFVHLHAHTHFSPFDGLPTISEMVDKVLADGGKAMGCADHGNVAAHPEVYKRCVEAGLRPVLGMEAYLQEDRFRRTRSWWVRKDPATGAEYEVVPEDYPESERKGFEPRNDSREALYDYQHITLWAMDEVGLRNLWAMSTEAFRDGLFGGKPRLDYDTLRRHSEGVIASTGCLRGPLAVPFLAGDEAGMQHNLARLMDIFPDRLYVELHTNHLEDQARVNRKSVEVSDAYGLPLIACVDSHYTHQDEDIFHRAWLSASQGKGLTDDSDVFSGDDRYDMMSESEVRQALAEQDLPQRVIDASIANTAALANRCTARVEGEAHPPVYSRPSPEHPDPVLRDAERVMEMCLAAWEEKVVPAIEAGHYTQEEAEARLAYEFGLLTDLNFCGYFLLVQDYVAWARQRSLVGPGRGSGGGSFVAYLMGITGLDALALGLMFERFINPGRGGLPDFDVDFETWMREPLKDYIRQRWGSDYTLSIGTNMTFQVKGAFDAVGRILKESGIESPTYSESQAFKDAFDESASAAAGTEVTWDRFRDDHEDLVTRLESAYPEYMLLVEKFVGRVRGFGKHAAGMVVSTSRPLTDLPQRVDEAGNFISQFDMNALEALGYVKFDILTVRNLDTIHKTLDLIEEHYGVRIDPDSWREEYEDPQVWDELCQGNTLGCFQIETKSGTDMTIKVQPRTMADLAADVTLNRPGPKRAKLDERYLLRRAGREAVTYIDPRLEESLKTSYGVPIFQEQIMAICQVVAGYTLAEADDVRRILGKKKVDQVTAAGSKFVPAAVERGMSRADAETLWAQLAEFAKYGFNASHAYGYSYVAYWTAWLKTHYPSLFLAAILSGVDSDRLPDFVMEARRLGYRIEGPDVNISGVGFTPGDVEVRYGLAQVPGIGVATAEHIVSLQPFTSIEDFRERAMTKGAPVNAGHLRALVHVGAFDSIVENRRAVDMALEAESSGEAVRCVFKDDSAVGPGGLPCTFDWANEPDPPMQSKGRGKNKVWFAKPPPKRCTVACRNYTRPEPVDPSTIEPYTQADLRDIERESLGVWISSTPFDRIDPQDLEEFQTASEVERGPVGHEYIVAAVVEGMRQTRDRTGGKMGFVNLNVRDGHLRAVVFASVYDTLAPALVEGALVYVALYKTERGCQVKEVIPAP